LSSPSVFISLLFASIYYYLSDVNCFTQLKFCCLGQNLLKYMRANEAKKFALIVMQNRLNLLVK